MEHTRRVRGCDSVGIAIAYFRVSSSVRGRPPITWSSVRLDELHHQVVVPLVLADIVKRDDVRVVQRRDRARPVAEAPAVFVFERSIGMKNLDRDRAAESGIPGLEDIAHSARTNRRDDS
jgi:hypothetical protein